MSLFEGLSIATRGLMASQLAMNVTGQNITNANTEGYSRKRLELSADYRRDGAFGEKGFGVNIESIERVRNQFIDVQIRNSSSEVGFYEEVDAAMERIENVFTEPSSEGINSAMDNFWNAWYDVANNPGDLSAREALRSTAKMFTNTMQSVSGELRDYRFTLNDQAEKFTLEINRLTSEIAMLNQAIVEAENIQSQNANDSRDRRDVLLEQLSKYVPITVVEEELGAVTVTSTGNMLVSPSRSYDLEVSRELIKEFDGTSYSKVQIEFELSGDEFDGETGKLAGILKARDEYIPHYESELDVIAQTLVREVNELHSQGYNLDENTGIYFFDPGSTSATTIQISDAIKKDANNIAAAMGGFWEQGGINDLALPADPGVGLPWSIDLKDPAPPINGNVQYFDLQEASVVVTWDPDPADSNNEPIVLREGSSGDYEVDYANGFIYLYDRTGTISWSTGEIDVQFDYQDTGFSGRGDGENALRIAELANKLSTKVDSEGNYTQNVGEYYASMIGTLGIERNEFSNALETRSYILTQIKNEQEEIAGVSLDEEMANMIKFENTYQASARFLSSIDQMIEILMNV